MRLLIGTSGFSYPEWRGRFYPPGLAERDMLRSYAEQLQTVEINNTFYRMPQPELLQSWSEKVASGFRFALKAPRSITHIARLKDADKSTARFLEVASTLGERLGPLLFQLPPFVRKDVGLLRAFLAGLPGTYQIALEFRHPSWFDDDVFTTLADRRVALVGGDPDEGETLPLLATAPFGYLRLRSAAYGLPALEAWRDRIAAQPWQVAHVYLKHEVLGPAYALALSQLFRGQVAVLPETPENEPPTKPRAGKKKPTQPATSVKPSARKNAARP